MRVNPLRQVDAPPEVLLQVFPNSQLQVLLLSFHQLPLAVYLQGQHVALVARHFVQAVAVALHVKLVQLSLLWLVQLSKDVVAAVLPIYNGVALLPAGHCEPESLRDWTFPHRYSHSLVVLQLQANRQLRWQFVPVLLDADMMRGALAGQHGLKMFEQDGIVDRRVVEVIHYKRQSQRPQQVVLHASDAPLQLEVAQNFASLEHSLTHSSGIIQQWANAQIKESYSVAHAQLLVQDLLAALLLRRLGLRGLFGLDLSDALLGRCVVVLCYLFFGLRIGLFILACLAFGAAHLDHLQIVVLLGAGVAAHLFQVFHEELLGGIFILQHELVLPFVLVAEEPFLDADGHLHSHEDKQVEGDDEGAGYCCRPRGRILTSSLLYEVVDNQQHHYHQLQHLIEGQPAELLVQAIVAIYQKLHNHYDCGKQEEQELVPQRHDHHDWQDHLLREVDVHHVLLSEVLDSVVVGVGHCEDEDVQVDYREDYDHLVQPEDQRYQEDQCGLLGHHVQHAQQELGNLDQHLLAESLHAGRPLRLLRLRLEVLKDNLSPLLLLLHLFLLLFLAMHCHQTDNNEQHHGNNGEDGNQQNVLPYFSLLQESIQPEVLAGDKCVIG